MKQCQKCVYTFVYRTNKRLCEWCTKVFKTENIIKADKERRDIRREYKDWKIDTGQI